MPTLKTAGLILLGFVIAAAMIAVALLANEGAAWLVEVCRG